MKSQTCVLVSQILTEHAHDKRLTKKYNFIKQSVALKWEHITNIYFRGYYQLNTLRITIYQTTTRSILVYHFTTISLQNLWFYYISVSTKKITISPLEKNYTNRGIKYYIHRLIGIICNYFIFWIYNIVILCVLFFNQKRITIKCKIDILSVSQQVNYRCQWNVVK